MQSTREARRFVRELVSFGEDRLGLEFDGSFRRFDDTSPTANWLYAVHRDRFCSAHSSGDTYRFTWDLRQARRWARRHRKLRHDTYLYSAEAHGGRACPITPSLLAAPWARQAYVVLHEAWHSTLRLGHIKMPYPLEEATGRVVGVMGATAFAEACGDTALIREARNQARDWNAFARWINRSYRKLDGLYRRQAPKREIPAIHKGVRADGASLRARTISTWEREELTREINNAFLFRYYDYTCLYPLAVRVYRRTGSLKQAMRSYQRAGRDGARAYLRKEIARP